MNENKPVVRFAPSPTGHLHIGGVRTALFNYFFARNQQGKYILRIEDTDMTRSTKEMADEIIEGLHWMGINWDSGPFFQSHRFDKYRETAFHLLEEKKAYRCFCTPEEIDARRKASEILTKEEQMFKYDRKCLALTGEEIQEKLKQKLPFVIRFFIPQGKTFFKDRIHKEMEIDNAELEDFTILKSDGSPTYHLSVVVDDCDMEITDVVRGDDHISNTYKQILLWQALGHKPPKFAHLPLILGPDKKKLSKRHGETSIMEFKNNGYLPEAIINYLSQLSWIPADSKNLFSMEDLIRQFSLGKLSKNSPVFDYDKLRFLNSRAIQEKKAADLLLLLEEGETFRKRYESFPVYRKEALIDLVKPRMKTLGDFFSKFEIYLAGELNYNNDDLNKLNENYSNEKISTYTRLIADSLEKLNENAFDAAGVEQNMRMCAEENGLKAADLIHPARFALTSETVSPSIFDVFGFFGKAESLRRLRKLAASIDSGEIKTGS